MRYLAPLLMAALFASWVSAAEACGDKFLRVGRGARYQRGYVAIHPACILLYASPRSPLAEAFRELEPALKRAGHKPFVVGDASALGPALKTGHYNLILADVKDVAVVEGQAQTVAVRFDVIPVLHRPSAATLAAVRKEYRCVAESPGKKAEVLAQIDDLMEVALKGTGEKNRRKP